MSQPTSDRPPPDDQDTDPENHENAEDADDDDERLLRERPPHWQ